MLTPRTCQRGFSLIELMVALVIVSLLLIAGAPSFSAFLQNRKIRNAADAVYSGLNMAKAEAVRRNTSVVFSLTGGSTAWTVGCANQTGIMVPGLNVDTCPAVIQSYSVSSSDANIQITASTSGGTAVAAPVTVAFNGYGQVPASLANGSLYLDFANTQGSCISNGGTMRCLRVIVSAGGQMRTCDPSAPANTPTSVTNVQAC